MSLRKIASYDTLADGTPREADNASYPLLDSHLSLFSRRRHAARKEIPYLERMIDEIRWWLWRYLRVPSSCISCDKVRSGVGNYPYVSISLSYNHLPGSIYTFAQPRWHVSLQSPENNGYNCKWSVQLERIRESLSRMVAISLGEGIGVWLSEVVTAAADWWRTAIRLPRGRLECRGARSPW